MRSLATLGLLAFAGVTTACPWWGRCCPRPVYCYPPAPPAVVRVVEAPPPVTVKTPEVANEDVAPDGWCHIRGRVVYDGDPIPRQKLIPKSGGAFTEDWVVNATKRGVQNVVVWLVPELTDEQLKGLDSRRLRDVPSFKPEQVFPGLSMKGERELVHPFGRRVYVPHVLAVQSGSNLIVRNDSEVPDNPKWNSLRNGQFNPLVPPGKEQHYRDLKTERAAVGIENTIYPWMRAYVWVLDHPYFAVTDQDGNFEIKFAPKGNLRLVVWHESVGFRNGREGRWGEPIKASGGRLDLGEIKLKSPKN
jgi:hypothetical protein